MRPILTKVHENDLYDRPIDRTPIYNNVYEIIYDKIMVLLPFEEMFRMEIEIENLISVQLSDLVHTEITRNHKIYHERNTN